MNGGYDMSSADGSFCQRMTTDNEPQTTATIYPAYQYSSYQETAEPTSAAHAAAAVAPTSTSTAHLTSRHSQTHAHVPSHYSIDNQALSSPPSRVPSLQVTHATPTTNARTRRTGGPSTSPRPGNTLEVTLDPYGGQESDFLDRNGKVIDDEELRKARKREMGRERQRRKRLRDKEKREQSKTTGTFSDPVPPAASTHLPIPSRSRSRTNLASSASFDNLPSSASTSYSSLPPMSASTCTISPTQSFIMSTASTSISGASSPGHSFSPAMSTPGALSFTDSGGWDHAQVFGGLPSVPASTSDTAVRVKSRAASTSVGSMSISRRPSQIDVSQTFGLSERPSPAKRRKSDSEDRRVATHPQRAQVGLGMIIGDDTTVSWGASARPKPRRTLSVPDRAIKQLATSGINESPDRSPTPPPVPDLPAEYRQFGRSSITSARRSSTSDGQSAQSKFFASSIIMAITQSDEWSGIFRSRLGIGKTEFDRMTDDLAGVYEKWFLESGMSKVSLDSGNKTVASSSRTASGAPVSPPTSSSPTQFDEPYATPSQQRYSTSRDGSAASNVNMESPSLSGKGRARSLPSGSVLNPTTTTPSLPSSLRLSHLETPLSRHGAPPATHPDFDSPDLNPTLQTPSTGQGVFPVHDGSHSWVTATAPQLSRVYDSEWRGTTGPFPQPSLSSPIVTRTPKDLHLGYPSQHPTYHHSASIAAPQQHQQPTSFPINQLSTFVSPDFSSPSATRSSHHVVPFTPTTPVPHRGTNYAGSEGVPMWYNQHFQNPLAPSAQMQGSSNNGNINNSQSMDAPMYTLSRGFGQ